MTNYTESQRGLQDAFQTRALADTLEGSIVRPELDEAASAFIRERDFFFLTTVSSEGEPTVSHKGGPKGTVMVLDSKTLAFPAYDGNGMFLSLGNIADTGKIGLLFMDFETPHRVRVQATAEIVEDQKLLDAFPGAIAVIKAHIDRTFVNCARYIHKYQRIETSRHVPDDEGEQPLASWKRIEGMGPLLSPADQARAEGQQISAQDYADLLKRGES